VLFLGQFFSFDFIFRESHCTGEKLCNYVHLFGVGAWLSLVERLVWDQDVAGSNPVAPTIFCFKVSFEILLDFD
jgi:hypothetical protein